MRIMLCALLMALTFAATAQESRSDAREEASKAFAKDLAALQMQVRKQGARMDLAQGGFSQAEYASYTQDLFDSTVGGAQALVAKWKGNPYVEVEGFSVAISITGPELSIGFKFK